ncbi:interleukin-12 receptor subunit beta-1 isoform X2 [Numida meleagris]|uniref:interleukin-12 receptor subunit beta-1 isoform X2 n=1 Tax=Numida meleagris TaxID=8996 RepID=UPI000B3E223C|nr:interleukin-12 receptor subunit beta-1 isoform X2 [Numida meleagris]
MWSHGGTGGGPAGRWEQEHRQPPAPSPSPWPRVKQAPLPRAPTSPGVTPCLQVPPIPPPGSPASGAAAPAPSPAPGHPTAPPAAPPTSSCSGESGALCPTRSTQGTLGDVGDTVPPPCTTGERFPRSYVSRQLCQRHDAGTATVHILKQHDVYIHTNATAWVEGRWGQHLERSPNITLHLGEAVKLDPPPDGTPFAKANGRLQLWLPRPQCHHEEQPPPRRQARFRRVGDGGWTQVTCETGKGVDGEDDPGLFHPMGCWGSGWGDKHSLGGGLLTTADPVCCELGGTAAFEVQLRHRTQHWSSHWSDWSASIFIPEEILESPKLNFNLGQLGRNGQRLLQLGWQRAREAQGEVTYTLRARMPACGCAEEEEVVLGPEETEYNLTLCGAAYDIMLTATNAAGTSPAWRLHVLAEQDTGSQKGHRKDEAPWPSTTLTSPLPVFCHRAQLPGHQLGGRHGDGALGGADPRLHLLLRTAAGARNPTARALRAGGVPRAQLPGADRHGSSPSPAPSRWLQPRGDGAAPHAGPLEAPACYWLAVHGRSVEQDWATFAQQHHFVGNTSLAASVRINASADAAVLRWEPSPRAACPGALLGYHVCHAAEGDNVTREWWHHRRDKMGDSGRGALGAAARALSLTDGEVNASASHYALRDLKPGTAYRVGIQEMAAGGGGTCSARWHFQTTAPGVGAAVWSSNLKYLGISLGLPAAALIYQLSKKRLHGMLFPPLPKPTGSEALRFSASEMSQVSCNVHPGMSRVAETSQHSVPSPQQDKPWKSFVEPSEQLSPGELLVMELSSEKEAATSTQPHTPQLSSKEPTELLQPCCEMELPFAYRRQEVPDPEPAGSGGVPTCGPTAAEEGGVGSWGLSQALVPLVLLKPITPQDQEDVGLLQDKVVP